MLAHDPKKMKKIIGIILCFAMIFANSIGAYYLNTSNSFIDSISNSSDKQKVTVSLYVLKHSPLQKISDLEGESIGYLKTDHTDSMTDTVFHHLKTKDNSFSRSSYTSSVQLVNDFLGQKTDCMLINNAKLSSLEELDGRSNIRSLIRPIYTYTYYKKIDRKTSSNTDVTHSPFTVLISGSDSRGSIDEISRSDVNMLVTVNPKTHIILMTSIPRDYYVSTACDVTDGCAAGQKDKLTHTGLHGINTTEKTIESFMGVDIDYNVKVGFNTVTQLVDAMDGIDVYNPQTFTAYDGKTYQQGMLHLNGDQALAFSRERYSFAQGDRTRGQNQMRVLTGIFAKMMDSPSTLIHYGQIMNLLSDTFHTNMSSKEISSLIRYQLQNKSSWTIYTNSLDGQGGTAYCYELGDNASVVFPDNNSISEAKQNIQAVQIGDIPSAAVKENVK